MTIGEPFLPNVPIELLNSNGMVVGNALTGSDGKYSFSNLQPDIYTVNVLPPVGFRPTFDRDGIVTPNTAMVAVFRQSIDDADFGYIMITTTDTTTGTTSGTTTPTTTIARKLH